MLNNIPEHYGSIDDYLEDQLEPLFPTDGEFIFQKEGGWHGKC